MQGKYFVYKDWVVSWRCGEAGFVEDKIPLIPGLQTVCGLTCSFLRLFGLSRFFGLKLCQDMRFGFLRLIFCWRYKAVDR
jgi:hypothetical protein